MLASSTGSLMGASTVTTGRPAAISVVAKSMNASGSVGANTQPCGWSAWNASMTAPGLVGIPVVGPVVAQVHVEVRGRGLRAALDAGVEGDADLAGHEVDA